MVLIQIGFCEVVLVDCLETAGTFLIVDGLLKESFNTIKVSFLAVDSSPVTFHSSFQQPGIDQSEHLSLLDDAVEIHINPGDWPRGKGTDRDRLNRLYGSC